MGLARLVAIFMLALGLYLLGQDASAMLSGTGGAPQPLEAVWRRLDPASLYAAQTFVERHLSPDLWDGSIALLLKLPAWLVPLGLGLGLLTLDVFAQRRAPKRG